MNPIEELTSILESQDVTQPQQEALIDLVVWAMYVDGRIEYEENEQIDEVIDRLSAASKMPIRAYLYPAIAKIRDVWSDPDRAEGVLADIDARLGTDALRHAAYALCEAVTHADDRVAGPEEAFLERLQQQFGLTR